MPLFGQILAALYQDDLVEEEDIRRWHGQPESKGEGLETSEDLENIKRCWIIGAHMIHQFDEQGSDEDSSEEDKDQEEVENQGLAEENKQNDATDEENEEDEEEDDEENEDEEEDDAENEDDDEDDEDEDST